MNSLQFIFMITIFTSFMFLIYEQHSYMIDLFYLIQNQKKKLYEIEGLLYYSIAYYKKNKLNLKFPCKISFDYKPKNRYKADISYEQSGDNLIINAKLFDNNKLFCSGSCTVRINQDSLTIVSWNV